jgi:biopolymer transport protein ExbD
MAKAKTEDEETEANLLPVMNIMLLLIPALLLAMEVARMGAITVAPPKLTQGGAEDTAPPPKTQRLRVFVAEDGFVLTTTDKAGEPKRIALTDDRKDLLDPSRYDYAALETEAARLRGPASTIAFDPIVHVDAEGSVPMSALVATLDALRGSECRLGQVGAGENPPDECLFWNVIVDPGAGQG